MGLCNHAFVFTFYVYFILVPTSLQNRVSNRSSSLFILPSWIPTCIFHDYPSSEHIVYMIEECYARRSKNVAT